MGKHLPEIIMHYNVQDNKYYVYFGEDYVADTKDQLEAFTIFMEQIEILKLMLKCNET